jgi:homoserine dehydrogenase
MSLEISAILIGFGNVGRSFVSVLARKREYLKTVFGLDISITGAVEGREGKFHSAFSKRGLDLNILLETKRETGRISWYPNAGGNVSPFELIRESGAQVLLEVTPTNIMNGEPGLSHVRAGLEAGMHIVTSNKGPLIFCLRELKATARAKGLDFRYSASVAGALPIMPTLYYALMGCKVKSIEGILSATTNYILTQMQERGRSMQEALMDARAMGIAEADSSIDLQGYDTAVKLLIASNSCMECYKQIGDVLVSGIENVDLDDARAVKARGGILKLIGRAEGEGEDVRLTVGLEELSPNNPFHHVGNTMKAVTFDTDLLGQITLVGGESTPDVVAGAMLRDLLNVIHDTRKLRRRGRIAFKTLLR